MVSKRVVKAALKEYLGVTLKISDSELIAKYKAHAKHGNSTKKDQLKAIAKALGIKVKSNMKRSELLQLVKQEFDRQFLNVKGGDALSILGKKASLNYRQLQEKHQYITLPTTPKVSQTHQNVAKGKQTQQPQRIVHVIDAYQYAYLFDPKSLQFEIFQHMICPQAWFSTASQYVDVLCLIINILLDSEQGLNSRIALHTLPDIIDICHNVVLDARSSTSTPVELDTNPPEAVFLDILSFVVSQALWTWCFTMFNVQSTNECIEHLIIYKDNIKGGKSKKVGGTPISFITALKACFGIKTNAVIPYTCDWKFQSAIEGKTLHDYFTVINPFENPLNLILQRDDSLCLVNAYLTALFYSSGTRERIELAVKKLDESSLLKEALSPLLAELNMQEQSDAILKSAERKFKDEESTFNEKIKAVLTVLEKGSDEYKNYENMTFPLTLEYYLVKEIDERKFKVRSLMLALHELYGAQSEYYLHPDTWRGNECKATLLIADLMQKLNIPVHFVFVEDDKYFYTTQTYRERFAKAEVGEFVFTVSARHYPEIMQHIFKVNNCEYRPRIAISMPTLFQRLLSKLSNGATVTPIRKAEDGHFYIERQTGSARSVSMSASVREVTNNDTYGFTLSGISTFIVGYALSNVMGKGSHVSVYYFNKEKTPDEKMKLAHGLGCFDKVSFIGHAFGAYTQVQKRGDDIKLLRYLYNGHSSPLVAVPCPPKLMMHESEQSQWWPPSDFYYDMSTDSKQCDWIADPVGDINPIIKRAITNGTYKNTYLRYKIGIRGNDLDCNNAIGVVTSNVSAQSVPNTQTQGITLQSIKSVLDVLQRQKAAMPLLSEMPKPQGPAVNANNTKAPQPGISLRQIPASKYSLKLESLKAEALLPNVNNNWKTISDLLDTWFNWTSNTFMYLHDSSFIDRNSSEFKISYVNGTFDITTSSDLAPVVPTVKRLVNSIVSNPKEPLVVHVGQIVKAISTIMNIYSVDFVRFGQLLGEPIATRTRTKKHSNETFFEAAASNYMNRFALAFYTVVAHDANTNGNSTTIRTRYICQMIGRLMTMYLTGTDIANNYELLIPGTISDEYKNKLESTLNHNKAYPKYKKLWEQVKALSKGGAKVKSHRKTEEKLTHNGHRYSLWIDSKQKKYIKVKGEFLRVKRGKVTAEHA